MSNRLNKGSPNFSNTTLKLIDYNKAFDKSILLVNNILEKNKKNQNEPCKKNGQAEFFNKDFVNFFKLIFSSNNTIKQKDKEFFISLKLQELEKIRKNLNKWRAVLKSHDTKDNLYISKILDATYEQSVELTSYMLEKKIYNIKSKNKQANSNIHEGADCVQKICNCLFRIGMTFVKKQISPF